MATIAGWRYPGRYRTYDFDEPSALLRDHWAVCDDDVKWNAMVRSAGPASLC
ncbi:MAG TPA: hypothetical protein VFX51_20165 [Solirubrobacteraceae bacterium]|nr:hypothetical protein [Solirubrobacteraceae bacterium]